MLRPLFAAALLLQCGGAYGFFLGNSLPAMQRSSGMGAACRTRTSRAGATTGLAAASKEDAKAKGKWRGPGIPFKEKEYSAITASDDVIDDLLGKKFGNGYAFYGERERLKDKDYDELAQLAKEAANYRPERPNSCLVLGGTGAFGEWITMKVMRGGFNTRILARNFEKAEDMFGRDGTNLDIYFGDVKDEEQMDNACEDAQTVVFCAGGNLPFGPDSYSAVAPGGVRNLMKAVKKFPSIRRVILLSSDVEYGLGGMKSAREAEDILRAECPCDYAVVRLPKKFEIPGGECGTVISSKPAPKGTRVTPGDVGDAVTAILVMDDVAARADAAAAETGTAAPKIPRAPSRFTASVYNDEAAPPPLDSLGDLVKQIAKLSKE